MRIEKTLGIHPLKVYPVPGGEGEYRGVTAFEDRLIPVMSGKIDNASEELILLIERGGEYEAIPIDGIPEFLEFEEEDARRFSEAHGVKLIV